jgi:hypothetical protein
MNLIVLYENFGIIFINKLFLYNIENTTEQSHIISSIVNNN